LKWWLSKHFGDDVDIYHLYAAINNDKGTEMQINFSNSQMSSVFVTTP
jgi:hypothetical protein